MISPIRIFALLLLVVSPGTLRSDTVVLKSGEAITGSIIEKNAEAVLIEYKVSASITDQKSIPQAAIQKVEQEQPDEVAYAAVQGFKIDPEWSMQPDSYGRLISALNDFLLHYPANSHAADIKQNLDALTAEKARVAEGEMKFFGNWLTKEQAGKQHSQSTAQAAFGAMRDQAMQGNLIGALNTFETIKTNCKSALVYPGAVQFASSLIPNLQHQIVQQKLGILKEEENWKNTIAMATEPKKTQFIASRNQAALRAEAALAAAKKSGMKWTPIIPHSLKSLEEIERNIVSEQVALLSIPVAKMRESITLTNKAADATAAKDIPSAEALQKEAQALWPDNSALDYIKAEITSLKLAIIPPVEQKPVTAAKVVKKNAIAAAAPTPAPEEPEPFYMTSKGASLIVVAVLLLIGVCTLALRLANKPKDRADAK